ncbi:phosphatase PAP2 family protein [Psychrilyobacter atlanticus]|uniref:phosphatase PAP2 family protein n=1 Tax=Psychrilyobacter atlanticus TaxID=271091 RepID=UPI00040E94CE|nr:phosphatase PAP2 family protein [Psychrilyobacter atlanticus]
MNKETLMVIIIILIALEILREGYLKGFIGAFYKNLIKYKKAAIIGIILTVFSIVYLDLPVASKFSNKYYAKTLEGIENGARTASSEEIAELKKKIKVENINKEKYSKYERFLADQGDGDVAGASVVVILLIGSLLGNKKLIKVSKNAVVSVIASGILVNLLKYIISRLRPDVNMLPYQFFNWASWFNGNGSVNPFHSSSASLPSGHGIVSVAVAFSFYYGYKNKVIRSLAIVYSVVLSGARIYGTRHWLSDMISAAFLGVLVAKTIYEINKEKNLSSMNTN